MHSLSFFLINLVKTLLNHLRFLSQSSVLKHTETKECYSTQSNSLLQVEGTGAAPKKTILLVAPIVSKKTVSDKEASTNSQYGILEASSVA